MGQAMSNVVLHRARFIEMEKQLLAVPQIPAEDYKLKEHVSGTMYVREITIPKNGIITGRIYKFDHIEIMIRGDIDILGADGVTKHYTGHNVIEAKAGKRQAGYAREETVWVTINRVPDMPIEQMLDYTTSSSYADYLDFHNALDNQDYARFLLETNTSQEEMDAIVQIDDLVEMPREFDHLYVSDSSRDGAGLFSKKIFLEGDVIGPVRQGEFRTIAGRYANHSLFPTSKPVMIDNEFYVCATRNMSIGEEITMNYRDILRFRESRGDLCPVG